MKRIGAWHLIYNLDGSFRGYEGIAYDEDGNALPSQVYAQEGRDALGRPIAEPDGDDLDTVPHG